MYFIETRAKENVFSTEHSYYVKLILISIENFQYGNLDEIVHQRKLMLNSPIYPH